MSLKSLPLNDALAEFVGRWGWRDHPVLARLRERTSRLPEANMQIAPEQGQFMSLLAQASRATLALEVGVFTGYSALCVALALPAHGRLVALDIDPDWTAVAREHWEEAGVAERIELRLGPALDSLDALLAEGMQDSFDFAFIDADKTNYAGYYERALRLLRPGGLLAIDNVFWGGRVADPHNTEPDTEAIRALTARIHADDRVNMSIVPIGDGLLLACKREYP